MPIRQAITAAAFCTLLVGGAARAQDWHEYAYPQAGFSAQFPAQPTVSQVQYHAGAVTGPATVYAARQGSADYSVTVADLSASPVSEDEAVGAAIKALAEDGRIKLDVRARIDRQFGREVSVQAKSGGQITTAVFYVDKKLYVLAGRTAPEGSGLAARFQQSLQFIDAAGNPPRRPEDGPGFGRRRRPPPEAFADCKGKAEGEAVQHTTPRGDVVAATCVATPEGLAARPNRRFPGPPSPEGPGREGSPLEG